MSDDLDSILAQLKDVPDEWKQIVADVLKRRAELFRDWLVADEGQRASIAIESQALKSTLLNLGEAKAASVWNQIGTLVESVIARGIKAVLR